ncbi:hypothetical protein AB1Y20_013995 [Prymnesium parvum]|uniref:Guanine nucleotide-binding protein subunit beta-like protein n=1 Tax=Prymnesium parvum TaxID=97485 RepID=A0AB34IG16_PRYPA
MAKVKVPQLAELRRVEDAHALEVTALHFSADGSRIVSVSRAPSVLLWDGAHAPLGKRSRRLLIRCFACAAHTLELLASAKEKELGPLTTARFSPTDKATLAIGGALGAVRLLDSRVCHDGVAAKTLETRAQTKKLDPLGISAVRFSPSGAAVVACGCSGTLLALHSGTLAELHAATVAGTWIFSIAFTSDGSTLLSSSEDHCLRLWDAARITPRLERKGAHESSIRSACFSADDSRVVSASSLEPLLMTSRSSIGWVTQVLFAPDGTKVISISDDHSLKCWDAETMAIQTSNPRAHASGVTAMDCAPNGSTVVSGSTDKSIKLWDLATLKLVREQRVGFTISAWCFSPDQTLVACAHRGTLRVCAAGASAAIPTSPPFPRVSTYGGGGVDAADLNVLREVCDAHKDGIKLVCFSPDAKKIASSSEDCSVKVWDADTLVELAGRRNTHQSSAEQLGIVSMQFSLDSSQVITVGSDLKLRVWDLSITIASSRRNTATQPVQHASS